MAKKNVNKETITEAALEILHEKGLAHLTMRNLAAKLEVKAPALYWYIQNKQELLQLISDYICSQIKMPERNNDWEEELILLALEIRRVLLSIPDGPEIMMDTLPISQDRLRMIDKTLEILNQANIPEDKVLMTTILFNNYVTSFVLDEQKQLKMVANIGMEEIHKRFMDAILAIPSKDAPYVHKHMLAQINNEESFLTGLKIILKGIKAELG